MIELNRNDHKTEYYPCSNPQKIVIFWDWVKAIVSGIIGFVVYIVIMKCISK